MTSFGTLIDQQHVLYIIRSHTIANPGAYDLSWGLFPPPPLYTTYTHRHIGATTPPPHKSFSQIYNSFTVYTLRVHTHRNTTGETTLSKNTLSLYDFYMRTLNRVLYERINHYTRLLNQNGDARHVVGRIRQSPARCTRR